jgi:predicted regulator of Ras-like GTPase activity (Roadblock/LC7/MglB family)
MDAILDGILEVSGVAAALVVDANGALVAHRGRSVYDRSLCELLAGKIAKVADAVQLQQEDWEAITAQFSDGKLVLRSLGTPAGAFHVLAIVADATLNPSFATVAIRVAANKLKKALAGGPADSSALAASRPPGAASAVGPGVSAPPSAPPSGADSSVLSGSGLTWSKTGSSVGISRVQAADPASAAFLGRCAKELARHVGPMAKVYVEEGVRRVAGDQAFAMVHAPKLLEDLSGQIEDADDRAQFRKAIQKG